MVKLTFDIPRRMKIAAQEIGTSGNPDAICFECPFRGDTCGGANETAMSMPRRVEWYKRLAKENNITRAQAAEISGIPLDTINSVMTGRTEDPRHSTLQAISKAYNGGCWGKYPCHIAALLIRGELEDDSSDESKLRAQLESAQREMARLEDGLGYFKEEVRELKKTRKMLLCIILALFLFIISILIVDLVHPSAGWFRL